MIDTPNEESTPVYNTVDQAQSAFANLLNATDESQEQTTEPVEATQDEPQEVTESEAETAEVEEQSQALGESEVKYRSLMQEAPDAILLIKSK